ncbi:MAG: ECF-type sigma factor, partial [Planctomycetota bacterium]
IGRYQIERVLGSGASGTVYRAMQDDPHRAVALKILDRTDFLALDDALQRLEAHNARWYEFVMHRYFAGRPLQETAEIMGMGMTTAKSTWNFARAWLRREMESA